jgi:gamma-glutamylcyclotransferase (GGCT)/AIG2-like uncharacterized protein YtfP
MPEGGLRINRSQLQQVFGDDFEALRQFEVLMEQINDWSDIGFPASGVLADTTSFAGKLSSADDTVQKALDTLDDHIHDDRYYTETELDAGQLDTRYYTETESDTLFDKKIKTITSTAITESINASTTDIIRQTASGITTTLTGLSTGVEVTVKNDSGGTNIIANIIGGEANQPLYDGESFHLVYNGTDLDIL